MRLDSALYRLAYRRGTPRWDNTEPRPELKELLDGRAPGRALDLGCGTGTTAIYLASQGWDAVGVDFAPEAIATARERAQAAGSKVTFVISDVTRLRQAGIKGPFDLILDIGCYHAIPARLRDAYAREVAALARPGADLYLAGITNPPTLWRLFGARGITTEDLRHRFGHDFDQADQQAVAHTGHAAHFLVHHLTRKPSSPTG